VNNKGEISTLKAWLILLASLIDDAALVALIFLALWFFNEKITWVIILVLVAAVAGFFFLMHRAIVPGLRRRKITGAEGMLGVEGRVVKALAPRGIVKIKNEYWNARSVDSAIAPREGGGSAHHRAAAGGQEKES